MIRTLLEYGDDTVRHSHRILPIFLEVLVVATTLLTFGLSIGKAAVVVDELFEIKQFVAQPLLNFFTNYWANGQLPHVLLAKAFGVIPWDMFNLRFGSVVAGTLCVPLIYRVGCYLFNRPVGTLSSLLLSLTVTHIRYAAYARGYSLMLMLSLITLYCFRRAIETGQRYWWVGFAISLAINIHNHSFTIDP